MKSLVLVLALILAAPRVDAVGERITTKTFDGIVVYPGGKAETKYWWIPERRHVFEAEAALAAAVSKSSIRDTRVGKELARYKRQYQPVRRGAERRIAIFGFHDSQVADGRWLRQPLVVNGGGDLFFVATYSLDTRSILSMRINAPK